ncbi:hypothetical protein IFM89_038100 [Coptis chinensis]|uniref:Ribonuclease H1 N-terminal domain-containing protein n=1 Tax=Coptis chinensis TaxID=261450 RepID=A0A835M844_9MAGN|nr:hypothetical protein IFM89_038100 [Coptis chinensis]
MNSSSLPLSLPKQQQLSLSPSWNESEYVDSSETNKQKPNFGLQGRLQLHTRIRGMPFKPKSLRSMCWMVCTQDTLNEFSFVSFAVALHSISLNLMAKFCYTVIRGWQLGIYRHWSSCRDQVHKFAGQDYIGCNSIEEAKLLLRKKGINNYYNEFNQTLEETIVQPIPMINTTTSKTCMQTEHNSQSILLRNMALVIIGLLVILIALIVRLTFLLDGYLNFKKSDVALFTGLATNEPLDYYFEMKEDNPTHFRRKYFSSDKEAEKRKTHKAGVLLDDILKVRDRVKTRSEGNPALLLNLYRLNRLYALGVFLIPTGLKGLSVIHIDLANNLQTFDYFPWGYLVFEGIKEGVESLYTELSHHFKCTPHETFHFCLHGCAVIFNL